MKKRFFMLLLTGAFFLLLTGCSVSSGTGTETSAETTSAEPQPYPIIVNDIEIKASPEKIVCLSPFLTEILYEMGYGDRIIARSGYCDYPEAVLSAEDLGKSASPDIDRIIGLAPDIVLSSAPIASKDIFRMQQANIAAVFIPTPTTIDEFRKIYSAVGLITNGLFAGEEIGEAAFAEISQMLGNSDAIKVGTFVYITENLDIATGDTFESGVLSSFGVNLAAEFENYEVDKSLFLENQPDVVFLNGKYTSEDLQNDEYLSHLDAVLNGNIIIIDNEYFERPSSRIIEMLQNLMSDYKKLLAQTF